MSLVLVCSDVHIHPKWLSTSEGFFNFLTILINECKPSHFLHLGDLFEDKNRVANECKNLVVDFLTFLSQNKIFSTFLVGNHEWAQLKSTTTYFIGGYPLATEISVPIVISILGRSVLFLPFTGGYLSPEEVRQVVDLKEKEKVDLICIHGDIKGFKYSSGFVTEDGWDYEGLRSLLKPKGRILCGHYHLPNIKKGIIGAPYMRDFRDAVPHDRLYEFGVYLFDFSKDGLPFKFIPFNSTYYVKLSVTSEDQLIKELKIFDDTYKGKFVKLWIKQKGVFDVEEKVSELVKKVVVEDVLVTGLEDEEGEEVVTSSEAKMMFSEELLRELVLKNVPSEYEKDSRFLEIGEALFGKVGIGLKLEVGGERKQG